MKTFNIAALAGDDIATSAAYWVCNVACGYNFTFSSKMLVETAGLCPSSKINQD
jgi:hypothetical protein